MAASPKKATTRAPAAKPKSGAKAVSRQEFESLRDQLDALRRDLLAVRDRLDPPKGDDGGGDGGGGDGGSSGSDGSM
jgi:hypothetical protein